MSTNKLNPNLLKNWVKMSYKQWNNNQQNNTKFNYPFSHNLFRNFDKKIKILPQNFDYKDFKLFVRKCTKNINSNQDDFLWKIKIYKWSSLKQRNSSKSFKLSLSLLSLKNLFNPDLNFKANVNNLFVNEIYKQINNTNAPLYNSNITYDKLYSYTINLLNLISKLLLDKIKINIFKNAYDILMCFYDNSYQINRTIALASLTYTLKAMKIKLRFNEQDKILLKNYILKI